MCACRSAQAGVQSPIRRTLPPWIPAFELVNLSVSSRDQRRASFETAASRLPQDEVFLNAIKEVPHPEEAQGAVSKDADVCAAHHLPIPSQALRRPRSGRLEGRAALVQL